MKFLFFPFLKRSIGVLAVFCLAASCDNDDDKEDTVYTLSGNGNGVQEVPANTKPGTATLSGDYDKTTGMLTYTVNWTNLSGTANAAHFHGPALAGANAGVLVPLTITNNTTNGTATGSVTIVDSVFQHFLNGRIYYNIHTTAHPGGELRGQVTMQQ